MFWQGSHILAALATAPTSSSSMTTPESELLERIISLNGIGVGGRIHGDGGGGGGASVLLLVGNNNNASSSTTTATTSMQIIRISNSNSSNNNNNILRSCWNSKH